MLQEFEQFILANLEPLGWFGPVLVILLMILEIVFAPIPGGWLVPAVGALYGPWLGFIYSYIGAILGSWLAYELARKFGPRLVQKLIKPEEYKKYRAIIQESRWKLFGLYLIPLFPIDVISLALGAMHYSRKHFLLIITVGFIPNILILAHFGDKITQPEYQYILYMLLVGIIGWFIYKMHKNRHSSQ